MNSCFVVCDKNDKWPQNVLTAKYCVILKQFDENADN